ncbi:MAG TPA: SpvB/TcaC N-terminal domain-containing protein, partial [Micromonosporaceae bacterium]|nr:SpvB/TcaC N-terminal domain-containing protein [Micromonosporaceae bacterium]
MRTMSARGDRLFFRPGRLTRPVAVFAVLAVVASGLSASRQVHRGAAHPDVTMVPADAVTCGSGAGAGSLATASTTSSSTKSTGSSPPDYQAVVNPSTQTQTVSFDGVTVSIPPGAVQLPVGIGISKLAPGQLPKLDSGMTNVTGTRRGYRFTPHPFRFATSVEVTLPYDPALIPPDFTAQDIYTYFYDDVALCWQNLERVSVDEVNHTVTSLTDHFTDMINATVTVPEHPEGVSFNPNQIKGISAADPSAGVNLINPPGVNSQGENRLSFPIEVPPGRLGLQPTLGVNYNSSATNGWLGVGWDLPSGAIMVDTRWGVPRYLPGQETETYQLNGDQLTPVAHRGPLVARTPEKVFHTRVEGGFSRIVRHGSSPASYTWEVTDRAGTHWFYGALPGEVGPADNATLADNSGRVYMWALREVRDTHGNFMRYHYAKQNDTGLSPGIDMGRNLYLQRITYTGAGTTEGKYAVTFFRDRELNEPLRVDKIIDARGGFKRVTADLLRRIDVTFDNALVRRYDLSYAPGAFAKTLLRTITQFDRNGAPFTAHQFTYYDDIRDPQGNYQAFSPVSWTTPGDDLSKDVLNLTPEQSGDASAINANTSFGGGGHLYVGVGTASGKSNSVGVKVGFSHNEDEGVLALIDVDGDALPDKVFRSGGTVKYRKNLSGPTGQARFSTQAQTLNLPAINGESSNSLTLGIEGYLSAVAAQLDYVNTFATTSQYFNDVNGDGITDLVVGSNVLFGRVGPDGVPVYGLASDTPVPVGAGTIDTAGLFGNFTQDRERLIDSFPLLDSLRRWVAPYDGTVRIEGPVKLADSTAAARAASHTADGVRVTIQRENTELWTDSIGAQDNTSHNPSNVDSVAVSRGDRIYFRVQSGFDGGLDEVSWDPHVSYLGVADPLDVNGLASYRFQASRDFTLGGRAAQVKVPLTGTMHLSGDLLKKAATTDDVTAVITRDGTPVLEQTLSGGSAGTVPVNLDIPVQQGQILKWRIRVDSPIDLDQVE